MEIPWILVSIAVGVIVLAILAVLIFKRKSWRREVDYRNYFNIGIIWIPFGIVMLLFSDTSAMGVMFIVLGLSYLAIGLKNKDKWGKKVKVSPKYQKTLMIAVLLGVIFLIIGIIVFELMR